ncbi:MULTISPECIES: sulfite exporter TauE/SafE family protein [Rhodococcus]|uniref:sulfite exporter TauE/SafE family protein n=1 Tax=Rhodococcus TaxID=1827 RepID=UPI00064C366B|nr:MULTISPECIES: sulfite exporter TauE/SafE family protein [Rhodococcus]NHP16083.1 sulfite exporter TauE/SafE family protein [Rhodococcus sp. IC4_135]MBJ7478404.1 sulfite exporter TauE/SafE family protein [Rhodococcus sp. (in: high G+C Gram-positive bacteria)]MDI9957194.1 sulfite exporter TauE/SafE family protein [Rhodococcus sp. IEGM 1237]MDI9962265.1 sulfite exporter TauE/SafE family protein [Rhodococcus sp. IEGM 1251]MDV8125453.1 sulfite exporter TauE/SafE family protein [Rhodococcus sp. IE
MNLLDFLFLVVAGFFSGLVGFVTGLASIVSYPALLSVGLSPVSANMTNTVALVAVGVGALANSSREVADTGPKLVRWSLYSAAGGIVGALILWLAPEGSFESVVPAMVVFASLALLLQPKIRELSGGGDRPGIYSAALFAVAVYGGYFGAGAGVIFLAATLILTSETVWRATILKSFFLGIANLVAALIFAFSGQVHWVAALAMALGALAGGWCGPPVVKKIPPSVLRVAVATAGFVLALWLWVK